jgi:hypothetical protein
MPFTLRTLNGFEMHHRMAACEIPAKRADYRAFIGAYPPDPDHGISKWRVHRFELPSKLIDHWFAEEDLLDSQRFEVDSLEAVEDVLRSWAIALDLFDAPWKCDWPL